MRRFAAKFLFVAVLAAGSGAASPARASLSYPLLSSEISESLKAERYFDAYFLSYWGELEIPEKKDVFRLARAVSSWKLGDPDQALHLLDDIVKSPSSARTKDQGYFYEYWIRKNLGGDDPDAQAPAEASADLKNRAKLYQEAASLYRNPQEYSPWVNGVLSAIIPGAGHARLGLWQDAALTFALNLIGIAATVEFARHDMPFAAAAAGGVTSVFYVGGIISSAQAAQKINLRLRAPFLNQTETRFFPELEIRF